MKQKNKKMTIIVKHLEKKGNQNNVLRLAAILCSLLWLVSIFLTRQVDASQKTEQRAYLRQKNIAGSRPERPILRGRGRIDSAGSANEQKTILADMQVALGTAVNGMSDAEHAQTLEGHTGGLLQLLDHVHSSPSAGGNAAIIDDHNTALTVLEIVVDKSRNLHALAHKNRRKQKIIPNSALSNMQEHLTDTIKMAQHIIGTNRDKSTPISERAHKVRSEAIEVGNLLRPFIVDEHQTLYGQVLATDRDPGMQESNVYYLEDVGFSSAVAAMIPKKFGGWRLIDLLNAQDRSKDLVKKKEAPNNLVAFKQVLMEHNITLSDSDIKQLYRDIESVLHKERSIFSQSTANANVRGY